MPISPTILGNLAQRSLSMVARNCEGKVPQASDLSGAHGAHLEDLVDPTIDEVRGAIDHQVTP